MQQIAPAAAVVSLLSALTGDVIVILYTGVAAKSVRGVSGHNIRLGFLRGNRGGGVPLPTSSIFSFLWVSCMYVRGIHDHLSLLQD